MDTLQTGLMAAVGSFILGHAVLRIAATRSSQVKPLSLDATILLAGVHLVVGFAVTTLYGTVNDVSLSTIAVVVLAVWLLTVSLLQITTLVYRLPRSIFLTIMVYWMLTLSAAGLALGLNVQ